MRLLGVLALAQLACATTRAQTVESWPDPMVASQLLQRHWDAPAGSDAQFRKNTVVIGPMVRREADVLELQTNERKYVVRCRLTKEAVEASASLTAGQLVALRGVGRAINKDAPELQDCAVIWVGDPPGHRPADAARNAVIAAESSKLCAIDLIDQLIASEPTSPYFVERRERLARMNQQSREAIAAAGGAELACDHPLVILVSRCKALEGQVRVPGSVFVRSTRILSGSESVTELEPECAADQVIDAVQRVKLED